MLWIFRVMRVGVGNLMWDGSLTGVWYWVFGVLSTALDECSSLGVSILDWGCWMRGMFLQVICEKLRNNGGNQMDKCADCVHRAGVGSIRRRYGQVIQSKIEEKIIQALPHARWVV